MVQAWLADERFAGARLVVVTRGAAPVEGTGADLDPAGAALWGLVRSAQVGEPGPLPPRGPEMAPGADLGTGANPIDALALAAALAAGEPEVVVRAGAVGSPD